MILKNLYVLILSIIFLGSCSDGIVSECPTNPANIKIRSNFTSIQTELFNKNCALSGCHSGSFPSGGMDLTSGNAYQNIVGKLNSQKDLNYIEPGNSSLSFLYQRVSSSDPGNVMPASGKLPQYMIDTLRVWIDAGALNN
jgi:hypothetical protein